jgi:hypothetical protein
MRRCLECDCNRYGEAKQYTITTMLDSDDRPISSNEQQLALGRCICGHRKKEHEPGWFGQPLVRAGRDGPVLFNRSLLLLGPLALIIGTSGGSITVNGKAEPSGLTVLIEVAVALALLTAASPVFRRRSRRVR